MATSEGQKLAERLIPRQYQIELFQEARKRNVGQNQLKVGMIAHKWFSCSTDLDKICCRSSPTLTQVVPRCPCKHQLDLSCVSVDM